MDESPESSALTDEDRGAPRGRRPVGLERALRRQAGCARLVPGEL